jgi:hypothetical protein
LRRKARCETARDLSPIVVYVNDQSTDSPRRRHSASNAFSSSMVSRPHRSTKFRRDMGTGGFGGTAGGSQFGS